MELHPNNRNYDDGFSLRNSWKWLTHFLDEKEQVFSKDKLVLPLWDDTLQPLTLLSNS